MSAENNVLIVEDEEEWCGVFERAVHADRQPRTVKVATDQISAEQIIDATKFALAIIDVGLDVSDDRNVDGLNVMGKIRDIGDKTSILVVTGRSGQDALRVARDAIMEYHAYDTVGKSSVVPAKLKELVKQGLDEYKERVTPNRTDAREAIRGDMNPVAWDDQVMRKTGFQGDVIKFYGFLNDLFAEYLPLLPRRQGEKEPMPTNTASFILEEFWSRAIGSAVLIGFGSGNELSKARQAALADLGFANSAEPVKELKSHGIEGVVYVVPDRHREEFRPAQQ